MIVDVILYGSIILAAFVIGLVVLDKVRSKGIDRPDYGIPLTANSAEQEQMHRLVFERAEHKCEFCAAPSNRIYRINPPKHPEMYHLDDLLAICEGCYRKLTGRNEKNIPPHSSILYVRRVFARNRTYFLDVKETRHGMQYLVIRETKKVKEKYEEQKVIVFEEDFDAFFENLFKIIPKLKTKFTNEAQQWIDG
ncbi:MAG: DUF3276 family protein [Gemmatimonadetes bacterium]|nr:MAG: DUF3276 family protein [Gemmatimonadota bacterium]